MNDDNSTRSSSGSELSVDKLLAKVYASTGIDLETEVEDCARLPNGQQQECLAAVGIELAPLDEEVCAAPRLQLHPTIRRGVVRPGAVRIEGIAGSSTDGDSTESSTGGNDCYNDHHTAASFDQPFIAEATMVVEKEDQQLEAERARLQEEIRDQLIREAVEAGCVQVVAEEDKQQQGSYAPKGKRILRKRLCGFPTTATVFILLTAAVAITATAVLTRTKGIPSEQESPSSSVVLRDTRPTLEVIRERGYIRCGLSMAKGLCFMNSETGQLEGLNVDQCRALSMAIFGTPDSFMPVFVSSKTRFEVLNNHSVDVITAITTHTLSRNVYEPATEQGYTFSVPYFYDGLAFGGIPNLVSQCAEQLNTFDGPCRDLQVCVIDASTLLSTVQELLPGSTFVKGATYPDLRELFEQGKCNVVAGGPLVLAGVLGLGSRRNDTSSEESEPQTIIGDKLFTREPVALVTRSDDPEWSNLVNLIVNVFFLAEANGISKSSAHQLPMTLEMTNNPDLASAMEVMVSVLGNYGDLYDRHLESIIPRHGLNTLYDIQHDSSGLLYYMPFGDYEAEGPGPTPFMTIETIRSRGYLRCGVIPREAKATKNETSRQVAWLDFDIEFCNAVASALFPGISTSESVQVVLLSAINDTEAYISLNGGSDVDIVAGALVTLQSDYIEPTTTQGFTFSVPYYYDITGKAFALMTCERDSQWSSFVNWIVMAMFYADDQGIGQSNSRDMPIVGVFGGGFKQMLRDCIRTVGSYGEAYNRTMEMFLPRSGANRLNAWQLGPQQYPIPYR